MGWARLGAFFLLAAWLSGISELSWSGEMGIGLSGVVYAYFGYVLVNRDTNADFARLTYGRTVVVMIGWLFACFVLTYTGLLRVANFAHLGGFVAGCLVGFSTASHGARRLAQAGLVACGVVSVVVIFWAPWQEPFQMARAFRALERNDHATALREVERIRARNPANSWALLVEASLRQERGEYSQARNILSAGARESKDKSALNALAWLLATCPESEIRNGPKAVAHALKACALDEWKSPELLDTLAAAYAEAGNFAEAEKWSLKSLSLPDANRDIYQAHLSSFRAGAAWRDPPSKP